MADRMDVNPRATAEDTPLNDGGHRMARARSADAINRDDDLIDLLETEQEGFSPVTHEGQSGHSSKEPAVSKHKKSIRVIGYLTGSSSQEDSQREPHRANIEDLQSNLDAEKKTNSALDKELRKVQRRKERLDNKLESASREINRLVQKRNDAEEAHQVLEAYASHLEKKLESDKEDHRKHVSQLEDQIKALTRTSDQLRQMLVPVSEKQTYDRDVISKFNNLNKGILGLTRQTWTTALKPGVNLRRLSERQQQLLGEESPLSYNRLRSVVFIGVCEIIFGPQAYFLGHGFEEFESSIQQLERHLNRNVAGDDRQQIMEWRDATFKVTEGFRDNGFQLSTCAQNQIWNFLSPLQVRDAAAEEHGQKKLKAICDNAAEFSLMIRQLKDDFKVNMLDGALGKPLSHWEKWAEEVASIPTPVGVQSGTIAYVIHGALTKSPKENLGRVMVLQKADVVVFQ